MYAKSPILNEAWRDVIDWQRAQFPAGTLAGAAAHLHKEAAEVRSAVELEEAREVILEEAADCFFMVARVADMLGCGPHEFADFVANKLAKNRARTWPTAPNAEGVYAHAREVVA